MGREKIKGGGMDRTCCLLGMGDKQSQELKMTVNFGATPRSMEERRRAYFGGG